MLYIYKRKKKEEESEALSIGRKHFILILIRSYAEDLYNYFLCFILHYKVRVKL